MTVELFNKDDYLLLRIQDNGKVLMLMKIRTKVMDLKICVKELLEIGATFHIVSLADSGTRIEVKAPLNKEDSYDD